MDGFVLAVLVCWSGIALFVCWWCVCILHTSCQISALISAVYASPNWLELSLGFSVGRDYFPHFWRLFTFRSPWVIYSENIQELVKRMYG